MWAFVHGGVFDSRFDMYLIFMFSLGSMGSP